MGTHEDVHEDRRGDTFGDVGTGTGTIGTHVGRGDRQADM